ncbi:ethylene-responsive transcription factor ERF025 [Lactuca sativa]|uniref:AP2/ERF domain-containing protein n=1 Tax=Lactuca sativa TaxID=4236 RepID=A0A9R1W5S1_LACSA|nr:ethylene-responsive transcription factor ERF025 [Lactuca sativa]KAJ0217933.1 hypothetical protein LSAT_V11C300103700 [Lactuca sativa]
MNNSSPSGSFSNRRSPVASVKHPSYRGIRSRNGKWVSEIREPRKSKRIWLGTYPTLEMAAAAYDVPALSLKGRDAMINFPDFFGTYALPLLPKPAMIRSAAAAAAELMKSSLDQFTLQFGGDGDTYLPAENKFMDDEILFDMPKLLVDMAEGMLISPPRQHSTNDLSLVGSSDCNNLWSY